MNSRFLPSALLSVGVVLMVIMWWFVFPSAGSDATISEDLAEILDNTGRAITAGVIGTLAFISLLIGWSFLARFMADATDGILSQIAELGRILLLLCAAVLVVNSGLMTVVMDSSTELARAEAIFSVADAMGEAMGMFWGLALFFVGSVALYVEINGEKDKIATVVRAAIAIGGVLMFIEYFLAGSNGNTAFSAVAWMWVAIVTLLTGIGFYIRGREQSKS
jgi:hypothetical protein